MKGWKTVAFNVVSGLIFLLGWGPLTQWIDPQYIALGVIVGNFVLRFFTDTPVFKPEA